MPYPYYPINYQPNYYGTTGPQLVPQQTPNNQPQNNSGFVWVSGEAGAKSYLVAPGQSVLLMDSEAETFYIKSADVSGMPLPLRIFDYSERREKAQQATNAENVTRAEFEALRAEVARLAAPAHNEGGLTDG